MTATSPRNSIEDFVIGTYFEENMRHVGKIEAALPLGVGKSSQGGKSPEYQRDKINLQAAIGLKAVITEVTTGERRFPEGIFDGSHQVYLDHIPKIISTGNTDKMKSQKE